MIILLAVSFGACSGKQGPPDDILSKEQFTHLLIETHLLEAKIERLYVSSDSASVLFDHFQRLLFEEQGVDSLLFYRTLDYYKYDAKRFMKIYEAVTDSLLEMEAKGKLSLREDDKKEPKTETDSLTAKDSIRNIPIQRRGDLPKFEKDFKGASKED